MVGRQHTSLRQTQLLGDQARLQGIAFATARGIGQVRFVLGTRNAAAAGTTRNEKTRSTPAIGTERVITTPKLR